MGAKIARLPFFDRTPGLPGPEALAAARRHADRVTRLTGIAALVLGLGWLVACGWYLAHMGGPALLRYLAIHELAAIVAGGCFPLLLLVLLALYIRRAQDVRLHTRTLERQLALLTYPAEDGEMRIRHIGDALRRQADDLFRAGESAGRSAAALNAQLPEVVTTLQQAAENVGGRTDTLISGLVTQSERLEGALQKLAARQEGIEETVAAQAAILNHAADHAHDRARDAGEGLRVRADATTAATDDAVRRIQEMESLLRDHAARLERAGALQKQALESYSGESEARLAQLSEKLTEQYRQYERSLADSRKSLEAALGAVVSTAGDQATQIGDDLESHAGRLDVRLAATLQAGRDGFADLSQEAASHIDALAQATDGQVALLRRAVDESAPHIAAVRDALSGQLDQLARSSRHLRMEAEALDKATEGRRDGLTRMVEELDRRVVHMRAALREQAEAAALAGDTAVSRADAAAASLQEQGRVLLSAIGETLQAGQALEENIAAKTHSLDRRLREGGQALSELFDPTLARADRMVGELRSRGAELQQAVGHTHQEMQKTGELLQARVEEMKQTGAQVAQTASATRQGMRDDATALRTLIGELASYRQSVDGFIDTQTGALNRAAREIGETASSIDGMLRSRTGDFASMSDRLARRVGESGLALQDETERLRQALDAGLARMNDLAGKFADQHEKLSLAARDADGMLDDSGRRLGEQARALTDAADRSSRAVTKVSDALALQQREATGVAVAADDAAERGREMADELAAQSKALAVAGDLSERSLRTVGANLERQIAMLEHAAGMSQGSLTNLGSDIVARADALMRGMAETGSKVREANMGFAERARELTRASEIAERRLAEIRDLEIGAQRNSFLRSARFLVEELNSISIDLTRILEAEISRSDWKQYVKGDKGIFTRGLLRLSRGRALKKLRRKMQQETETRDHVNRYIARFEHVCEESRKADPDGILEATFMTADVGKLYLLLNRASGRED